MAKKALIAIGGNSLIRAGEKGTLDQQYMNARATAKNIVAMIKKGWNVVITHGNGPQAGAALLRSERAGIEVYSHTLDMCVATTQSEIGYLMQRAFVIELQKENIRKLVLTIPTMVEVDPYDKAYENPQKPIGPFYSKANAESKSRELGWKIIEDAARGYRRVVASPSPKRVLEYEVIKKNMNLGIITIAAGGGGIPVIIEDNGEIRGSEAVIDKDRTSALLAEKLKVDLFIISTDTDRVYINYKKRAQKGIDKITLQNLQKLAQEGHFPAGSMGPKVESVIKFVKNSGKEAIITSFNLLDKALEGKAGTRIIS